jgi:hypothetical protein
MMECRRRNVNGFSAIDPKDAHPLSALPLFVNEYRRCDAQLKKPAIKKMRALARNKFSFSYTRGVSHARRRRFKHSPE